MNRLSICPSIDRKQRRREPVVLFHLLALSRLLRRAPPASVFYSSLVLQPLALFALSPPPAAPPALCFALTMALGSTTSLITKSPSGIEGSTKARCMEVRSRLPPSRKKKLSFLARLMEGWRLSPFLSFTYIPTLPLSLFSPLLRTPDVLPSPCPSTART